ERDADVETLVVGQLQRVAAEIALRFDRRHLREEGEREPEALAAVAQRRADEEGEAAVAGGVEDGDATLHLDAEGETVEQGVAETEALAQSTGGAEGAAVQPGA